MSWIDWRMAASQDGAALTDYVARLISLRREHPVLRCPVFLHGKQQPAPGIADIEWFDDAGGTISAEAWNDREQRTLILRRATNDTDGKVSILTLLLNPTDQPRQFRLPTPHLPARVLIDSSSGTTDAHWIDGDALSVAGHSVVLLHAAYPRHAK
jgi:glycogen operon protein